MSGAGDRHSDPVAFDRAVVRAVGDDVDAVPFAVAADAMLKAGALLIPGPARLQGRKRATRGTGGTTAAEAMREPDGRFRQ